MRGSIDKIAVCGLGKLGACIAGVFASKGMQVVGIDKDPTVVSKVKRGIAPIFGEPGLVELYESGNVKGTSSHAELVRQSEACCFIVPTPSMPDGKFDNSYLIEAMCAVAREVAHQKKQDYIFVVNSTVTPGTCCDIFIPMLMSVLGELRFGLCYKPEFIALGTVVQDLQYPDVILIGASDSKTSMLIRDFYSRITLDGHIHTMDLKSAELAKISLNCFVTMKISFANQIFMTAKEIGADADLVLAAVGDDKRVGNRNLKPGLPFGGPCFPRDNRMMRAITRTAPLSTATDWVNEHLKQRIYMDVVRDARGPIGILGTAYKPGTRVTEESLGTWLYKRLTDEGYEARTYDPIAPCSHSLHDVLDCQTIAITCGHKEFKSILFSYSQHIVDPSKVGNPIRIHSGNVAVPCVAQAAYGNKNS